MFEKLKGYKTYLVAFAMAGYEVLGYFLGEKASIDVNRLLEAFGLATIRAGIGKVSK